MCTYISISFYINFILNSIKCTHVPMYHHHHHHHQLTFELTSVWNRETKSAFAIHATRYVHCSFASHFLSRTNALFTATKIKQCFWLLSKRNKFHYRTFYVTYTNSVMWIFSAKTNMHVQIGTEYKTTLIQIDTHNGWQYLLVLANGKNLFHVKHDVFHGNSTKKSMFFVVFSSYFGVCMWEFKWEFQIPKKKTIMRYG